MPTNAAAVGLLRTRKRRPDRPLALMFPSLDDVRRHCELSDEEARTLGSPAAPILLLQRLREEDNPDSPNAKSGIVESVAPGNPTLGVMLPYTPLHHLLLEMVGRPLVCTSGNLSEEPMAISTEDALARLGDDNRGDCIVRRNGLSLGCNQCVRHRRPVPGPQPADRASGR